ncbi:MAG: hypothetical protein JWQ23_190 [Herminiimonas sp.]|jgi:hypothetical protein|nr:hypothetical protein [Herminiimonas sp.]
MSTNEEIGAVLQKYSSMGEVQSADQVEQDFDQVTKQAPIQEVSGGLSEAIRSDQTPSFGQMLGEAYREADAVQQAEMLNQLLQGVSPDILDALKASFSSLSSHAGGATLELSPEQAARITPEQVEEFADKVEKANPAIVDVMSVFYARNPTLAKPLGATVLGMAMDNIAHRL